MDWWQDERIDRWIDADMDSRMDRGCRDGWMDGWHDWWINASMDRCVNSDQFERVKYIQYSSLNTEESAATHINAINFNQHTEEICNNRADFNLSSKKQTSFKYNAIHTVLKFSSMQSSIQLQDHGKQKLKKKRSGKYIFIYFLPEFLLRAIVICLNTTSARIFGSVKFLTSGFMHIQSCAAAVIGSITA